MYGNMLLEAGYKGNYVVKAIEDFVPHSTVEQAYEEYGFDVDSIINFVTNGD